MKPVTVAAIALAVLTAPAARGATYKIGEDIQRYCADGADPHDSKFNPYNSGACIGYIDGVVDGYEELRNAKSQSECVPTGTKARELVGVVLAYLQSHPKDSSELGARSVILAIKTKWSC